jgi:hypothetical protein
MRQASLRLPLGVLIGYQLFECWLGGGLCVEQSKLATKKRPLDY